MRSIRWLAAVTGILALGTACGGGESTPPPENQPPVASFSEACTNLSCVFTDASTDPDGNNTITSRAWTFGDNTSSNETSPTHAYAAAGAYVVTLTVTDNEGATSDPFTRNVTVTAPAPNNIPPVASFDLPTDCVAGTPCGFHSTSTDADGTIAPTSIHWDFGGGVTAEGPDATHTFIAPGQANVTLTVTDDDGATGTVTHAVTVAPQASQDCTTSSIATGGVVDCTLTVTQRATVRFVFVSEECGFSGNRLTTTSPVARTIFGNMCNRSPGEITTLNDDLGAPLVLNAGSTIGLRFFQGSDPVDPRGDPGIRITGSYPTWVLNIDDGGRPGEEGEPDFDDAVVRVEALAAP